MNLGVGVYIFMLQRVSIGILRFFATYIWHFLGYAIAFHIIMPRDGAFLSLTDTIIKVFFIKSMINQRTTLCFMDAYWATNLQVLRTN